MTNLSHNPPPRSNAFWRWLTPPRLILLLLATGLLWRTARYFAAWPIWGDEAFVAVDFLTRDYAEMLKPSQYGQIVPLLFMWGELAIVRALGTSEYALRLLPFIAGLLAVFLYWRFVAVALPRSMRLLPLGFFTAAYFTVRHGAEVKPYATDLLISLVFLLLAWRIRRDARDPLGWIGLLILAAGAGWASYTAIFCAGGVAIWLTWLVWRRRLSGHLLVPYVASCIALLAGFAVLYFTYAKPHAEFASKIVTTGMWSPTFPPWKRPWKIPLWLAAMHTGLMMAYPYGGQTPGSIATTILVILGSIRLWRKDRGLLLLLLAPLIPTFLAASLQKYPYGGSARTSLYMAPAFCLLAGLGLHWLFALLSRTRSVPTAKFDTDPSNTPAPLLPYARDLRTRWTLATQRLRRLDAIGCLVLAGMAITLSVTDLIEPYKAGPVKASHDAAKTIAAAMKPDDRWVMFNAVEKVPYAPWLGDWRGVGGQFVFDALRFTPTKILWAPSPDTVTMPDHGHLWLVTYRVNSEKAQFPENQWQTYLATIQARCGHPQFKRYEVKNEKGGTKVESIDVYRFDPR